MLPFTVSKAVKLFKAHFFEFWSCAMLLGVSSTRQPSSLQWRWARQLTFNSISNATLFALWFLGLTNLNTVSILSLKRAIVADMQIFLDTPGYLVTMIHLYAGHHRDQCYGTLGGNLLSVTSAWLDWKPFRHVVFRGLSLGSTEPSGSDHVNLKAADVLFTARWPVVLGTRSVLFVLPGISSQPWCQLFRRSKSFTLLFRVWDKRMEVKMSYQIHMGFPAIF